jgi:hypothetical protein
MAVPPAETEYGCGNKLPDTHDSMTGREDWSNTRTVKLGNIVLQLLERPLAANRPKEAVFSVQTPESVPDASWRFLLGPLEPNLAVADATDCQGPRPSTASLAAATLVFAAASCQGDKGKRSVDNQNRRQE